MSTTEFSGNDCRCLPKIPPAEHLAKLKAAASLYPYAGRDPLMAWELAEDLAAMPEFYRKIRQWVDAHVPIALKWSDGVKSITRQNRLDRAERYFERLLEAENIAWVTHWMWHPRLLRVVYFRRMPPHWRNQGFTLEELDYLRERFKNFWKKF